MSTFDDASAGDTFSSRMLRIWPTLVLACGLATTALTLGFVYWLGARFEDFQLMGLYAHYLIPIGPVIVGMAAGCGYGVGCWLAGQRIRIAFLVIVATLQLLAYAVAQYEEYKLATADLPPNAISFADYYDTTTRSMVFEGRRDPQGWPAKPLGVWGYGVRVLETLGFVAGGVLIPLLLMPAPYCERCARYMRRKSLANLPAGVAPRKVKRNDMAGQQAYRDEIAGAMEQGREIVARLKQHVEANDVEAVASELGHHAASQSQIAKQTSRFRVQLLHCRRCSQGALRVSLVAGHGQGTAETEIVTWDASPELVHRLRIG